MMICAVGPVRPEKSATRADNRLSPGRNTAVAETMSQNCAVATGLIVFESRVGSEMVHAEVGEKC